jgi:hypothetical protein
MPIMDSISLEKANQFVLKKQYLANQSRIEDIVRVARDISGLHATGTVEPYLALFARTKDFNAGQLNHELYVRKSLGKIRCMRATLYILAREMIPVAFAATKALVQKLSGRYAEFRGISQKEFSKVSKSVLQALKGREMTLAQIKAELDTQLNLSALINLMCGQGLLVRVQSANNWRNRSYRYAPFSEYFEDIDLSQFSEADGTTLMVRSYLSSFGPATENDIAWWLGESKGRTREALSRIAKEITPVRIIGLEGEFICARSELKPMANLKSPGEPTINLLPTLDPYLMGYKQRERYLGQEHYNKIFDRGGNATSTILLDGRVVGVWDFSRDAKPRIKIYLLEKADKDIRQQIEVKAQEIGRFIAGQGVDVEEVSSMEPFTQRTVAAFMSPLKGR